MGDSSVDVHVLSSVHTSIMTEVEPGRVIQWVRAKPATPTRGCRCRPLGALAYRGDTYIRTLSITDQGGERLKRLNELLSHRDHRDGAPPAHQTVAPVHGSNHAINGAPEKSPQNVRISTTVYKGTVAAMTAHTLHSEVGHLTAPAGLLDSPLARRLSMTTVHAR